MLTRKFAIQYSRTIRRRKRNPEENALSWYEQQIDKEIILSNFRPGYLLVRAHIGHGELTQSQVEILRKKYKKRGNWKVEVTPFPTEYEPGTNGWIIELS